MAKEASKTYRYRNTQTGVTVTRSAPANMGYVWEEVTGTTKASDPTKPTPTRVSTDKAAARKAVGAKRQAAARKTTKDED